MQQKRRAMAWGIGITLLCSYAIMWLRTMGLVGLQATLWTMGGAGVVGGLTTANSIDTGLQNHILYGGLTGVVAAIVWSIVSSISLGIMIMGVPLVKLAPPFTPIVKYLTSFHILGVVFVPLTPATITIGGVLGGAIYGMFASKDTVEGHIDVFWPLSPELTLIIAGIPFLSLGIWFEGFGYHYTGSVDGAIGGAMLAGYTGVLFVLLPIFRWTSEFLFPKLSRSVQTGIASMVAMFVVLILAPFVVWIDFNTNPPAVSDTPKLLQVAVTTIRLLPIPAAYFLGEAQNISHVTSLRIVFISAVLGSGCTSIIYEFVLSDVATSIIVGFSVALIPFTASAKSSHSDQTALLNTQRA